MGREGTVLDCVSLNGCDEFKHQHRKSRAALIHSERENPGQHFSEHPQHNTKTLEQHCTIPTLEHNTESHPEARWQRAASGARRIGRLEHSNTPTY